MNARNKHTHYQCHAFWKTSQRHLDIFGNIDLDIRKFLDIHIETLGCMRENT